MNDRSVIRYREVLTTRHYQLLSIEIFDSTVRVPFIRCLAEESSLL